MRTNYDDVIEFARQRHAAYTGDAVTDPWVKGKKFTNVFRVLDRGSQYLLHHMDMYDDPIDRLALSYFYRQVNRPDTMDAIIDANDGYVPNFEDITSEKFYDKVVAKVIADRPGAFLNGAYIILIKAGSTGGTLAKMREMFPAIGPHLRKVAGMNALENRVAQLRKSPGLGPFLAMQIATDLGYCAGEPDQENTFVVAGPGSRKGVAFMSSDKPERVIAGFPVDQIPTLPGSYGRPASLMDIQNVFCEYSKYVRYRIKGVVPITTYQRHEPYHVRIPGQFIHTSKRKK
jgi:hypothetical protein